MRARVTGSGARMGGDTGKMGVVGGGEHSQTMKREHGRAAEGEARV